MDTVLWIVDLLIPVLILGFGVLFWLRPPKKINHIYGYRTKRSMASQAAWDFAHALAGKLLLGIGCVLVVLTVIFKIVFAPSEMFTIVVMCLSVASLFVPVVVVERRLKEEFDDGEHQK